MTKGNTQATIEKPAGKTAKGSQTTPQTGAEYLDSLRDDRTVFIYGERVKDVTTHPAFRNTARMVARLFDAMHDEKHASKIMVPTDTGNGAKTHAFFKAPKSLDDLLAGRNAIAEWARITYGWLGRSPDYKASFLATLGANAKMPSVIRFLRVIRARKKTPKFSRENVYGRDSGRCQYCMKKIMRHDATYDHVTPRALGGKTTWENVVIACVPCNQKKGARTVEQAGMHLRTMPSRPKKLPDAMRFTITFQKGMPHSWKSWLRDFSYWNGELENDNGE